MVLYFQYCLMGNNCTLIKMIHPTYHQDLKYCHNGSMNNQHIEYLMQQLYICVLFIFCFVFHFRYVLCCNCQSVYYLFTLKHKQKSQNLISFKHKTKGKKNYYPKLFHKTLVIYNMYSIIIIPCV